MGKVKKVAKDKIKKEGGAKKGEVNKDVKEEEEEMAEVPEDAEVPLQSQPSKEVKEKKKKGDSILRLEDDDDDEGGEDKGWDGSVPSDQDMEYFGEYDEYGGEYEEEEDEEEEEEEEIPNWENLMDSEMLGEYEMPGEDEPPKLVMEHVKVKKPEVEKIDPEMLPEVLEEKRALTERYINAKRELKALFKKNAYLQDRIYRSAVRKGIIQEESDTDEEEQSRRRRKSHGKYTGHSYLEDDGEGEDDDSDLENNNEHEEEEYEEEEEGEEEEDYSTQEEEEDPDPAVREERVKRQIENDKEVSFTKFPNEDKDPEKKKSEGKTKKKKKVYDADDDLVDKWGRRKKRALQKDKISANQRKAEELANENRYKKIIKSIAEIEEAKGLYTQNHKYNIFNLKLKREEWARQHGIVIAILWAAILEVSDQAVDSSSGKRMNKEETEAFLREATKIHEKLCGTLVKMYKTRRGLELSIKRLQESEIQGEGLQMLEYEQLRAENQTLSERLDERSKDVETIKKKIAHAVQILAHFREKMDCVEKQNVVGRRLLDQINQRVIVAQKENEKLTLKAAGLKNKSKSLAVESGLLDNTKLLHDFEKTHYDVALLKEEKKCLHREYNMMVRETEELRKKIKDIVAQRRSEVGDAKFKFHVQTLPKDCRTDKVEPSHVCGAEGDFTKNKFFLR